MKKLKQQPTEWERICANYISDEFNRNSYKKKSDSKLDRGPKPDIFPKEDRQITIGTLKKKNAQHRKSPGR